MRSFDELTEREILALAISQEEEDGRIYADFADGVRAGYPATADALEKMRALMNEYAVVGDVCGLGLLMGIELVKDRATKEPAKAECAQVLELCRELGLLLGKGGLHGSVIRFAPPMSITPADADFMLEVFGAAFEKMEEPAAPPANRELAVA